MTIHFKIAQLERQASDGFVTTVHWTASKTDGANTVSSYGTVSFNKEDSGDLIPFADLEESIVIFWVKNKLDVEALEAAFDAQLVELATPTSKTGLPW